MKPEGGGTARSRRLPLQHCPLTFRFCSFVSCVNGCLGYSFLTSFQEPCSFPFKLLLIRFIYFWILLTLEKLVRFLTILFLSSAGQGDSPVSCWLCCQCCSYRCCRWYCKCWFCCWNNWFCLPNQFVCCSHLWWRQCFSRHKQLLLLIRGLL